MQYIKFGLAITNNGYNYYIILYLLLKKIGGDFINEKNLIPLNKRPPRERKEISRKGAAASNKKQAERRKLREAAEIILTLPVTKDVEQELKHYGVAEDSYSMAVVLALIKSCLKGNVKAFTTLVELLGENTEPRQLEAPVIVISGADELE